MEIQTKRNIGKKGKPKALKIKVKELTEEEVRAKAWKRGITVSHS